MSAIPGTQPPNYRYFWQLLDEEVNRSDKRHRYSEWIRKAFLTVQQEASWNCMRMVSNVVIPSGSTSVALPGNFKEFTPEKAPIHISSQGLFIPCELRTFEQLASQYAWTSSLIVQPGSTRRDTIPVYKSQAAPDGKPFLNIFIQAGENLTFRISYFGFLPDLVADTDTNYLAQTYTEMIETKLKAIAFASINDPLAIQFETAYDSLRTRAEIADARQTTSGRRFRMGG